MSRKKKRGGSVLLFLAAIGLAAVGYGAGPGGWFEASEAEALEGAFVRRGPLAISHVVRGNLKAKNSESLKSQIEGQSTILTLVEEGTLVQPGDLVAELDVSELQDRRVVQQISVQNATADFTKAKEQYEIQVIQNESDIAKAKQEVAFAGLDLEKYINGEWPQELQKADEEILLKKEEMARAEDRLKWTQSLADRGFVQRTELEGDEFAFERSKIEWDQAKREKTLMEDYQHPRTQSELQANVEETQRDLLRVEKQSTARLADFDAARASTSAKLELETEKLAKLERQIANSRLTSPVEGMVVYARKEQRWGSGEPMAEGTNVYERQEIATIPRPGGMVAEASLHETVLKKVQVGQQCTITIDALPGQYFEGRVGYVAVLPDSGRSWSNPNQRVYRSEISIEGGSIEMRPGMSCSIEIHNAELEDVTYVPVQAVFVDGETPVCFVKEGETFEKRPVTVGLDNTKWVEIREGLAEGDLVVLSAPPDFEPSDRRRVRPQTEGGGGARDKGESDAGRGPGEGGSRGSRGYRGDGRGPTAAGGRPEHGGGGRERGSGRPDQGPRSEGGQPDASAVPRNGQPALSEGRRRSDGTGGPSAAGTVAPAGQAPVEGTPEATSAEPVRQPGTEQR